MFIRHFFQAIYGSFVGFREGHLLGLTDRVLDGRLVGFLDGLAVTKRLGFVLGA